MTGFVFLQENLALICGIMECFDFQKINRCGFVYDKIDVNGMLKVFLMLYLQSLGKVSLKKKVFM